MPSSILFFLYKEVLDVMICPKDEMHRHHQLPCLTSAICYNVIVLTHQKGKKNKGTASKNHQKWNHCGNCQNIFCLSSWPWGDIWWIHLSKTDHYPALTLLCYWADGFSALPCSQGKITHCRKTKHTRAKLTELKFSCCISPLKMEIISICCKPLLIINTSAAKQWILTSLQ